MMEIEFETIHEEALDELLEQKDLEFYYDTISEDDNITDCFDTGIVW